MEPKNDVAALIAAGIELGQARKNPNPHGGHYTLVPTSHGGANLIFLPDPAFPPRRTGTVVTNDTDSFISAVNRYMDKSQVVVYGQLENAMFTAVLNDHLPEDGIQRHAAQTGAGWRDHRVTFSPAHSEEWIDWTGKNGKAMSQEEFAYFIERNLPDFKSPTGSAMFQMALTFKVNRKMNYRSAINLADGTTQLEYADVNAADGSAGAPKQSRFVEKFTIAIPVWAGLDQTNYQVEAHLRYRVNNGVLQIVYELVRETKVIESAFEDMLAKIRKGVKDVPIIFGAPG